AVEALPSEVRLSNPSVAGNLQKLVERSSELLDLLQPQANAGHASTRVVNVDDVLVAATDLFRIKANRQGISLNFRRRDKPTMAVASPTRLRDVVANLITNAIDAKARSIRIRSHPPAQHLVDNRLGTWVLITFDDDGPGIPDDLLLHVFDLLRTTK